MSPPPSISARAKRLFATNARLILRFPARYILWPAVFFLILSYPALYQLYSSPGTILGTQFSSARWIKKAVVTTDPDPVEPDLTLHAFWYVPDNGNALTKDNLVRLAHFQRILSAGFNVTHDYSRISTALDYQRTLAHALSDPAPSKPLPPHIFFESPLSCWSSLDDLINDTNVLKTIQEHQPDTFLLDGLEHIDELVRSARAAALICWARRADGEVVDGIWRANLRGIKSAYNSSAAHPPVYKLDTAQSSIWERCALLLVPILLLLHGGIALSSVRCVRSKKGLLFAFCVQQLLALFAAASVTTSKKSTCARYVGGFGAPALAVPLELALAIPIIISAKITIRLVTTVASIRGEYRPPVRILKAVMQTAPRFALYLGLICSTLGAIARISHWQLARQLCTFISLACVFEFILHVTFFTAVLAMDLRRLELQDFLQRLAQKEEATAGLAGFVSRNRRRMEPFMQPAVGIGAFYAGLIWLLSWTHRGADMREVLARNVAARNGGARQALLAHVGFLADAQKFSAIVTRATNRTVRFSLAAPPMYLGRGKVSYHQVCHFDLAYFVGYACFVTAIGCAAYLALQVAQMSVHAAHGTEKHIRTESLTDAEMTAVENSAAEFPAVPSFKCKELAHGHFLDVVALATSACPFIVSVGMDQKILVWSPLVDPPPVPLQLPVSGRYLPATKVVMSASGSMIAVFSKCGVIRCWSRLASSWIWTIHVASLAGKKPLEAFFRRSKPAGGRRLVRRRGRAHARKNSVASRVSTPPVPLSPVHSVDLQFDSSTDLNRLSLNSHQDFVIVLPSGTLVTVDCTTGHVSKENAFGAMAEVSLSKIHEGARILACERLCTPRMNDRVVFAMSDGTLVVATSIGRGWRSRTVMVHGGYTTRGKSTEDAAGDGSDAVTSVVAGGADTGVITCISLATVPFVGMIVRVIDHTAQLIDVQSGTLLKHWHVGDFKPGTFQVFHPEPAHCRFCGCASVASFSVGYTSIDTDTFVLHTFSIDNRAKNNICLRVERDPRETRCLGFASVTEHHYRIEDVEGWCTTDLNAVIGIRRKDRSIDESVGSTSIGTKIEGVIRRRRTAKLNDCSSTKLWEGFTINAQGTVHYYEIPDGPQSSLLVRHVGPVRKFGHKSIVASFGNILKVMYLGNDTLIEDSTENGEDTETNSLSFINRRRRMRLERYQLTHSTNFTG